MMSGVRITTAGSDAFAGLSRPGKGVESISNPLMELSFLSDRS
jgi:hypothetical protein